MYIIVQTSNFFLVNLIYDILKDKGESVLCFITLFFSVFGSPEKITYFLLFFKNKNCFIISINKLNMTNCVLKQLLLISLYWIVGPTWVTRNPNTDRYNCRSILNWQLLFYFFCNIYIYIYRERESKSSLRLHI